MGPGEPSAAQEPKPGRLRRRHTLASEKARRRFCTQRTRGAPADTSESRQAAECAWWSTTIVRLRVRVTTEPVGACTAVVGACTAVLRPPHLSRPPRAAGFPPRQQFSDA